MASPIHHKPPQQKKLLKKQSTRRKKLTVGPPRWQPWLHQEEKRKTTISLCNVDHMHSMPCAKK